MSSKSKEVRCPRCGDDVPKADAKQIEVDMEYIGRSCIACGRTFAESEDEDLE